ncbi:MAG TPA: hypothetical protein VGE21_10315 [Flavobacteriales bacterium]
MEWDDFQHRPAFDSIVSEIRWQLDPITTRSRSGDTVVVRNGIRCLLDRPYTWVDTTARTERLLRYNRIAFDLGEACKRRIERDLQLHPDTDPAALVSLNNIACQERWEAFLRETHNGVDTAMVDQWSWLVQRDLSEPSPTSVVSPAPFGFGMHFGMGYGSFTGSLSDHFSDHFNLQYGIEFQYRRYALLFSGTLGTSRVRRSFEQGGPWGVDERPSFAMGAIDLGYSVKDGRRLRITPFAGMGVLELALRAQDGRTGPSLRARGISYGLNADVKLRKTLQLATRRTLFGRTHPSYNELLLRLKVFGMEGGSMEHLDGRTLNITVGICWVGRALRSR